MWYEIWQVVRPRLIRTFDKVWYETKDILFGFLVMLIIFTILTGGPLRLLFMPWN